MVIFAELYRAKAVSSQFEMKLFTFIVELILDGEYFDVLSLVDGLHPLHV